MAKNEGIGFAGIGVERNLDRGDKKSTEFGKTSGGNTFGLEERILDDKPGTGITGAMKGDKGGSNCPDCGHMPCTC